MNIKKSIILVSSFLLIIGSMVAYAVYLEPKMVTIKKFRVESTRLAEQLNNRKIAFISDLDIRDEASFKQFEKAVDKLNTVEADIVILGGDLFNDTIYQYDDVLKKLKTINAPYGKFAILGEKDFAFLAETESLLFQSGFELLQNRAHRIYIDQAPMTLIGLESAVAIDSFVPEHMKNDFTIALVHQPDAFLTLKDEAIDLQLSGHSYGGIIAFPFLHLIKKPGAIHYYQGRYIESDKQLIVSNGIGLGDYSLRFLAPPQITVVEFITKIQIDDPVPAPMEDNQQEETNATESEPSENASGEE